MDASISHCSFNSFNGPFVEVYLHVIGSTVKFVPLDSMTQASVEVLILIQQGEEVIAYDKYNLTSPLAKRYVNFLDQKRFAVPNGDFELIVELSDNNDPENKVQYKEAIVIEYPKEVYCQSGLQLLGAFKASQEENGFTKNGFYLEALPFSFYNKKADKLAFYNEMYNIDTKVEGEFLIRYFIDQVGDNGKRTTVKLGHKKEEAQKVNVVLQQMDITKLPSGNYYLTVEIRNRANELLSMREVFFQRSNPYMVRQDLAKVDTEDEFVNDLSAKELEYSLRAIAMQVKDAEVEILNIILQDLDEKAMRGYLFSYWAGLSPIRPETAYEKYMEVARAADKTFRGGMGYGFETDRGYTFMKYGKPNDMIKVTDELNAPPYEIWVYEQFKFTGQSRVKFLFYNPTLGGGEYIMLHSTARGEINNPQWEVVLYRNAPDQIDGTNYVDATNMQDGFLRRAKRLWDDI